MRYRKEILNRIEMSLRTVDPSLADAFAKQFDVYYAELEVLASEVNFYFYELLSHYGAVYNVGIPENEDAIVYWLDDIDRVVLPVLRKRKRK